MLGFKMASLFVKNIVLQLASLTTYLIGGCVLAVIAVNLLAAIGCVEPSSATTTSGHGPASEPSNDGSLKDLAVLAEHLDQNTWSSKAACRVTFSNQELLAFAHQGRLALGSISDADSDVAYLAEKSLQAYEDHLAALERYIALPGKSKDSEIAGRLIIEGGSDGWGGVAEVIKKEKEKEDALNVELGALFGANDRIDALRQLLPKLAEKHSAALTNADGRIAVDFDSAWGGFVHVDMLALRNEGPTLRNCLVVVDLTGEYGETRRNIHWIDQWDRGQDKVAPYIPGMLFQGKIVQKRTVTRVKSIDVTVYSPDFSTKLHYDYEGDELTKDVTSYLDSIQFTGTYQPFVDGWWDTERGCSLRLARGQSLPRCEIAITYVKGSRTKTFDESLSQWASGEVKKFETKAGQLTFDPDHIEITLTFPRTDTIYKTQIDVN